MHVYFIGIGGTAIGPLALIASQAGYEVSGSDKQDSEYIKYLRSQGINDIHIGTDSAHISSLHQNTPVDMVVYSSAVPIENPGHPEIKFAENNGIKAVKRDGLLVKIIEDNHLKLIAVAGTHGKTTTTAMLVWLFKQLGIPISYSVGAKISFGDMGHFDKTSEYFIYECDEFDRNFLAFHPYMSLITGISHDHHEQYPEIEDYRSAFRQFLSQSRQKVVWQSDIDSSRFETDDTYTVADKTEYFEEALNMLSLPGEVNRFDALQTLTATQELTGEPPKKLAKLMNDFPGVSRRFEKIIDNLYSDYAHTIEKIKGCLQLAREVSDSVVIVYEPLTNRRQHYIRGEYRNLFQGIKKLYWVPSYLAREDPVQKIISPQEFINDIEMPADKQ
ncbi:MAG TPA: Mur ligase domain-containing protein, partial [Candidatus Saccharimonadales bacterium]|nr:Mur ligase domain-containing protein [Candidatus Saccharimonadales bacterium]